MAGPSRTNLLMLCLGLVLLSRSTLTTKSQEDFEFSENSAENKVGKLEVTLLDDEDMQADQAGSGLHPTVGPDEGSGDTEDKTSTVDYPEYYRAVVNFTNLQYHSALGNRNSQAFQDLARDVTSSIESLYDGVQGDQRVNIIQFRPGTNDRFARPSLLVTFDLSTVKYYNRFTLYSRLDTSLKGGRIGGYSVSQEGIRFQALSGSGEDLSPTTSRPKKACQPYQFQCESGIQCIYKGLVCDTRKDCRDGSDEVGCATRVCGSNEFRCASGQCVNFIVVCNGEEDCRDGTDEGARCAPSTCEPSEFRCPDGQCIADYLKCNGEADCSDSSDERGCPPATCSALEFRCDNGQCIGRNKKCDGERDCTDASDELGCPRRFVVTALPPNLVIREGRNAQFRCESNEPEATLRWSKDGRPLSRRARDDGRGTLAFFSATKAESGTYRCTGVTPSGQRDDATVVLQVEYIGPVTQPPESGFCGRGQRACDDGQCIIAEYWCDGDHDCRDLSDEGPQCARRVACEPNEFQCPTGKCISVFWLCDGDDDCGDGGDEVNCATPEPGSQCRADEYQCVSGDQCIPAGYQCDEEFDCQDRSDEIGCTPPVIVKPPPPNKEVTIGEIVRIECEARGVPTPHIVWRLNWGHVGKPPRVTQTSENGKGVLIIRNANENDQGAYSCEAINNKGTIIATPDTILVVRPPTGVCKPPYFNSEARSFDECLQCFCFALGDTCYSSQMYQSEIEIGSELPLVDKETRMGPNSGIQRYIPSTRMFYIQDYSRRIQGENYYWSLPKPFLGNKLASYGSDLTYRIYYDSDPPPELSGGHDIIIYGNGVTLFHQEYTEPFPRTSKTAKVPFLEGHWKIQARGDTGGPRDASRPDIMLALQDLEYILIKSRYDQTQKEVRISDVRMGVGVPQDTGRRRVNLVEQCSCPTGYTGLSCDQCGAGFYRTRGGRFLGRCIPCNCNGHSNDCDPETGECKSCQHGTQGEKCEECMPGYYGDARKGTAADCKACPCPLTDPRNRFAKECRLDADNQVTCLECAEGYVGRRCERCAPGYQGDPRVPGGTCSREIIEKICDVRGSESRASIDGTCECKDNVEGEYCDRCKSNTFHLDQENPHGCVSCFCMGITRICSSTDWHRALIESNLNVNNGGVKMTDRNQDSTFEEGIYYDAPRRSVVYRSFNSLPDNVYYWSLPQEYLGDKVTAYGGSLRYTVEYVPGFDQATVDDPEVILSGNNIELYYHHPEPIQANQPVSFQVPFYESSWRGNTNRPPTRGNFLMALADLDYILIKSTYTRMTTESSLGGLSMDVAENRRTGRGRALAVEQCNCPRGYKGLSCQACSSGYTKDGSGLYLGQCKPCSCNGHSRECDPNTGVCKRCEDNTAGEHCELCQPGYYGDAVSGVCRPCPCPLTTRSNQFSSTCHLEPRDNRVTCDRCPAGYDGRRCERCAEGYEGNPTLPGGRCEQKTESRCSCDVRGTKPGAACNEGTRQCECKDNVEGINCDRCSRGYFNLDRDVPGGCNQCWCSGQTTQCSSSSLYRSQIKPVYNSDGSHNFGMVTRRLNDPITEGFDIDPANEEVTFTDFRNVQRERETLFFQLPPKFRGNQLASYGGYLKFYLEYDHARDSGSTFRDVDIEIISDINGVVERYYALFNTQPNVKNDMQLRMVETTFRHRQGNNPDKAKFMQVLANIQTIIIRATFHSIMGSATIGRLSLDSAVQERNDNERAYDVELCSCPRGYSGLSCETCADGYTQSTDSDTGRVICVRCECNGHASSCDPKTGICLGCRDNTRGEHCQECLPGYYGNAAGGTPNDCRPCPCPLTAPSNRFSTTCNLDRDGEVTCDKCPEGYLGRDCGRCASGYGGNPRVIGSKCTKMDPSLLLPVVTVQPLKRLEVVGAEAEFICTARGQKPIKLRWMKINEATGRRSVMPSDEINGSIILRFPSVEEADGGRFVCEGTNEFGTGEEESELKVLTERGILVSIDEPVRRTVEIGSSVTFICKGISKVSDNSSPFESTYILAWSKLNGEMDAVRAYDDGMGTLTIDNVQQGDAGTYECFGSNFISEGRSNAYLIVVRDGQPPEVRIDPRTQIVDIGEFVEFRCIGSGSPEPRLSWRIEEGKTLNPESTFRNGVFRIPRARLEDAGDYYCSASNQAGTKEVRTRLTVLAEPEIDFRIEITEEDPVNVEQGGELRLVCQVAPNPGVTITRVEWTRADGPLPPGSRQSRGVLIIPSMSPSYSGRYVCNVVSSTRAKDNKYIYVVVTTSTRVAPTVTMAQDRYTIAEGQSASIRCEVTGSPQPTITWSKVGGELDSNFRVEGNVLRIIRARPEDRAMYVCRAENSEGRAQAGVIIEIERRSSPVVVLHPSATTTIRQGGSALFQCRITQGEPRPTIKWTRASGEPLTSNTEIIQENVIRFIRVTGEEQGDYVCTATNKAGSVTATATLKITGPPRVSISPRGGRIYARLGRPVTFECMADGVPTPNVHWVSPVRRGDLPGIPGPESVGSSIHTIRSMRPQDAGTYVCVATNDAGRAEQRVEVIVQDDGTRPEPTPEPEGRREETVVAGSVVTLTCAASGNVPATLTWTRSDGQPLPANHQLTGGVLRIVDTQPEDAGEYKCTLRSQFGEQYLRVLLTVIVPPSISMSPQSISARLGDPVRITCSAEGTRPVTIEWTKVRGNLPPSAIERDGVLQFRRITAADSGRYRCVAVNRAGRAEGYADILVASPPTATVSPNQVIRQEGASVDLRCLTTGSPPLRIQWSKERGELPDQHYVQNGILRIFSVTKEDEGRYVCSVSNSMGTARGVALVRVEGRDTGTGPDGGGFQTRREIAKEGDRVEMGCQVTGSPQPRVRWERVGAQMPRNVEYRDNYLILPAVNIQDAGTYRCVASNQAGSVYAQVFLRVTAKPVIPVQRQERETPIGAEVVLTCLAGGDPPPVITWSKKDGALPREHSVRGGVLTIPSVQAEDLGEYVCTARNQFGTTQSIIVLKSGALIPNFQQNPSSFMTFDMLDDAYLNFDMEMSFNPDVTDGLVLYNGEMNDGTGDFVSFGMKNSCAELSYDMGSGPGVITSDPINLNKWHNVRMRRDRKKGYLYVDGKQYSGESPGRFYGMDLSQNLYLGGVPDYTKISRAAGYDQGYVGCISQFKVNGQNIDMATQSQGLVGVNACPVCTRTSCVNGGRCYPAYTLEGFRCSCPTGYSGPNCELIGERCYRGACGSFGRCQDLPTSGYRCTCPVGRMGDRCQSGIEIEMPSFQSNLTSYVAYPTMMDAQRKVDLSMMFKPRSLKDGILLYNSQTKHGHGDYIALVIKGGTVEFHYDSGSGPAVIRGNQQLQLNQWATVKAQRNGQEGYLIIDGGDAVKVLGRSQGDTVGLNLKEPMYIGGVSGDVMVAKAIGVTVGFDGCVSEVRINNDKVDLINDALMSGVVRDCGIASPCARNPCENNARCYDISPTEYRCQCPRDYTGKNCETVVTMCMTRNPCQNKGKCVAVDNRFSHCDCPVGFTGTFCARSVELSDSASFNGNAYLEMSGSLMPHHPMVEEEVIMTIETMDADSLFFWHGQDETTPGEGRDYFAVGINNGRPVLSYQLGSGASNITSPVRINDGNPHKIHVKRLGKVGQLQVDDLTLVVGRSGGTMSSLNTEGNIYLGGVPDITLMTDDLFKKNYKGCISKVTIMGKGPLDFAQYHEGGYNLGQCSSDGRRTAGSRS